MIGSFGQKWKDAQISEAAAAKKLRLSYHHLCHFGLSVEPGPKTPSKSVWVTASNYRIRNHACGKGLCPGREDKECHVNPHTMDYNFKSLDLHGLKQDCNMKVGSKIWEELHKQNYFRLRSTPDSRRVRPSEPITRSAGTPGNFHIGTPAKLELARGSC